jgi:hypothetical protein
VTLQTDEEGIFPDIAPADYHSERLWLTPSLSASVGKCLVEGRQFSETPRHAWSRHPKLNPDFEETHRKMFDMGSAAHKLTLGRGAEIVEVPYDAYTTKDAREMRDGIYEEGKIPVLSKDYDNLLLMKMASDEQLLECPWGHPFRDGQAEVALRWKEETKWGPIFCKALVDWLPDMRPVEYGVDFKSTASSANPAYWERRQLNQLGYDISAAFHLRGYRALGLATVSTDYWWILQEQTTPFCCSVIGYPADELAATEKDIQHMINVWAECIHTGNFPGYEMSPHMARRPTYLDRPKIIYDDHLSSDDYARTL